MDSSPASESSAHRERGLGPTLPIPSGHGSGPGVSAEPILGSGESTNLSQTDSVEVGGETLRQTAIDTVHKDSRTGRFLPGNKAAVARRSHKEVVKEKTEKLLDAILAGEKDYASEVASLWWKDASGKDRIARARARETLWDRLYGPPKQSLQVGAAPELLEAINAQNAMRRQLLGEVIEGEYRDES